MKYLQLLLLMISMNCCSEIKIKNLEDREINLLASEPGDLPMKFIGLKDMVIRSASDGESRNYIYKCEGLPTDKVMKYFIIGEKTSINTHLSFSVLKNGLLTLSSCSSDETFENNDLNKFFLRECAKDATLNSGNLFIGMDAAIYNNVEYIQWCILEETKNRVEIMEYIKFDIEIERYEDKDMYINPAYKQN